MNYDHSYHAGSFADVFKHAVLFSLIDAMQRKDTAVCYLDTHAGRGLYDLTASAAQKTKEYHAGIHLLLKDKNPPETLKPYLDCVKKLNTSGSLQFYPGSPMILQSKLRPNDRLVLSELHPTEHQNLKKTFYHNKQVSAHLLDGYQSLKAFLPPKERRGLILIDPPYEKPDEFTQLATTLPLALKRFQTGVYAIWFPIKDRPPIERFYHSLQTQLKQPMLAVELSIFPENSAQHLNGNGMLIINPPWQLNDQINTYLPWLWQKLSKEKQGQFAIRPLTV